MTPPATAAAPAVGRPLRNGRRTSAAARRRISGPVRAPIPAGRSARPAPDPAGLVPGTLALARRLLRHRLLDRLISGRAWIAVVAFALVGIVTLQLGLLRLNSSVGRSLEREAYLQRENAALAIDNSELAAGNRVESLAGKLDMQLVPVASLRFLKAHPHTYTARAVAALSTPPRSPVAGSEDTLGGGSSGTASQASAQPSGAATEQVSSAGGETASGAGGAGEQQASAVQPSETQSATAPAAAAQPPSQETSSAAPSQPAPAAASASSAGGEGSPAGGTQAGATG